ncbi:MULTISPECIES: hypothetical protein [unclassified Streptomyces]
MTVSPSRGPGASHADRDRDADEVSGAAGDGRLAGGAALTVRTLGEWPS